MAGPGGGPPRRSHTKSRKGCETCKRRHIRCDETMPQCRNCTKHKIRCPYQDLPPEARSSSPDKTDIFWNAATRAAVEHWYNTGVAPFSFPIQEGVAPFPSQMYTLDELRLVYHLGVLYDNLAKIDVHSVTGWTAHIPFLMSIGAPNNMLMAALLALSASHLAFLSGNVQLQQMASKYYDSALTAFRTYQVIVDKSPDVYVCTAIVLSWLVNDYGTWLQLNDAIVQLSDSECMADPTICQLVTENMVDCAPLPVANPQEINWQREAMQYSVENLADVEAHMKLGAPENLRSVQQLKEIVVKQRSLISENEADIFANLALFRALLMWMPIRVLQNSQATADSWITVAQYHTASVFISTIHPNLTPSYFVTTSRRALSHISHRLTSATSNGRSQRALELLRTSCDRMEEICQGRKVWDQQAQSPVASWFQQPSYPMASFPMMPFEGVTVTLPVSDPAITASYMPYPTMPAFSYSTESLALPPCSETLSASSSPLQLSASVTDPNEYLGVPQMHSPYSGSNYSTSSLPYDSFYKRDSTFGDPILCDSNMVSPAFDMSMGACAELSPTTMPTMHQRSQSLTWSVL